MRKERMLLIIGIWDIVLPFLGFPSTWRKILWVVTGILIIYLAYLFYLEAKARRARVSSFSKTFVDNIEETASHE